jgi:hypothetical protein
VKRFLLAGAASAALVLCTVVPARALAPSNAGWWWIAQSGAAPVPSPPTVPPGGLMVGGGPSGPTAVAALRFELEADQGSPVLTLAVADNGDVGGAGAVLGACPAASAWGTTYAGPWPSRPASTCARVVKGLRSVDGLTWTFNLAPLVARQVVDVVLQPLENTNFNLTFNAPTATALKTSPKPVAVASADSVPEIATSPAADELAGVQFTDLTGVALDTPAPSAPTDVGVAAPSPSGLRATDRATLGTASNRTRRASGLAVLLLLGVGTAAYALSQVPAPARRALGPLTTTAPASSPVAAGVVQVGGLGRFARTRTGSPPPL